MEGKELPEGFLYEDKPEKKVNVRELFSGKKGLLIAVMGAYTPVCSIKHIPGYVEKIDELKSKGYSTVVVFSVNDPYVTAAWKEQMKCVPEVRVLADPKAEFAKSLNLDFDVPHIGTRAKRSVFIIDNNVIKKNIIEPDGCSGTVTLVDNVLKQL